MTYEEIAQRYDDLAERAEARAVKELAATPPEKSATLDCYNTERALVFRLEANRIRRIIVLNERDDLNQANYDRELESRLRDTEHLQQHRDNAEVIWARNGEIYADIATAIREHGR